MPANRQSTIVGPIRTPEGHLAFPYLLSTEEGGQYPSHKYITTFLMAKTVDLAELLGACVKATQLEWPDLNITGPAQIKLPIRKGSEKPGWEDYLFFKCKSSKKPPIVDARKATWTGEPKGGDVCRLAVSAFAYKQQLEAELAAALAAQGKLVRQGRDEEGRTISWRPAATFLLNGVQWLRSHPAIGGAGAVDGVGAFAEEAVLPVSTVSDDSLFT